MVHKTSLSSYILSFLKLLGTDQNLVHNFSMVTYTKLMSWMNCSFNDMQVKCCALICVNVCAQVALLLCHCTFNKGIRLPMDSNVEVSVY